MLLRILVPLLILLFLSPYVIDRLSLRHRPQRWLRWLLWLPPVVVALMLVFVVIPMVLAVCYYYFGFRRECYVNAFPHTLEITPEGITATMHFKSRRPAGENPADETETEPEEKIVTEFFPSEMLGDIRLLPSSFTFPITSRGEKAEGKGKHS